MKYYLCIDLKTFYASVECVERGLDPFKTDLVVADKSKGSGTICLAISPKMKNRGIKNRCRMWEIPKNVKPIIAKPRMKKYIEYSGKIYSIYLKYISKEDIHPYSIDEMFMDVTSYLNLYKKSPIDLAKMIINDVFKVTGITATAGVGTNLFLSKVALDIISKTSKTNIGYLDEKLFRERLWYHKPLTDFWQIGKGIENRLCKYNLRTMHDIANANPNILYKEFGVVAEYLIDHSNGRESCTIKDIKNYKPKSTSISHSQILYKDYDYKSARIVLKEMIEEIVLELIKNKKYTDTVSFYIGYTRNIGLSLKSSIKLDNYTNSLKKISEYILYHYDYKINPNFKIRKVGVSLSNLNSKKIEQLNLFYEEDNSEELSIENAINEIKSKYGKNSILRAMSYLEEATQINRNKLIGGHNAE